SRGLPSLHRQRHVDIQLTTFINHRPTLVHCRGLITTRWTTLGPCEGQDELNHEMKKIFFAYRLDRYEQHVQYANGYLLSLNRPLLHPPYGTDEINPLASYGVRLVVNYLRHYLTADDVRRIV